MNVDRHAQRKATRLGMLPDQWIHYRNRAITHISTAETLIQRVETQHENIITTAVIIDRIARHLHAARILTIATESPNRMRIHELGRRLASLRDNTH